MYYTLLQFLTCISVNLSGKLQINLGPAGQGLIKLLFIFYTVINYYVFFAQSLSYYVFLHSHYAIIMSFLHSH